MNSHKSYLKCINVDTSKKAKITKSYSKKKLNKIISILDLWDDAIDTQLDSKLSFETFKGYKCKK